jgi:hypothetical protein
MRSAVMSRFPYSAQVFSYVRRSVKKRLAALRKIDPRRYSESRVIQLCLERWLPEIEKEATMSQKEPE